jgi:hypothetical protein
MENQADINTVINRNGLEILCFEGDVGLHYHKKLSNNHLCQFWDW